MDGAEAEPILAMECVCKGFSGGDKRGGEVLKDVSMSIRRGDLVSIIGPSGCGKSTLLRCINCLELPDSGTLRVCGVTLTRHPGQAPDAAMLEAARQIRSSVGMVFQGYNSLFPHKTVLENIMLAPRVVKGMRRGAAREIAMHLIERVGLRGLSARYPASLSGGECQRAAIARALAMSPSVMLYDEPTSALDPELVGDVLQVMRDLDSDGLTQLIVTHEMQFAHDASDYIIFMDKGEIVESNESGKFFSSPQRDRTKEFLRHFRGRMGEAG